ncbi:MAG: tyrosine--tRNA ligase [Bacteroidota bacterium]
MHTFMDDLQWRGMVDNATPDIALQLQREVTTGYVGLDPTGPSLHVGNLAAIMLLKHLQRAGHQARVLVGGATGMIGDPSGKSAERTLLDEEELRYNQACIGRQLERLLDCSPGKHGVAILNNLAWFKDLGLLAFLREVGKHLPLNYMLAKDAVRSRLERGISFTEFAYQLLQGYDFYYLYTTAGIKLQMGGADQWGNIMAGLELIRRKAGGKAFALTTPLITKTDGSKFGKSEGGSIWLDPAMTSPYAFYQFWLNSTDEEAGRLVKVFTLLDKREIDGLEQAHQSAPHQRVLQKALAKELTSMVHSAAAYTEAARATELLFGRATPADLWKLSEQDLLAILGNVPQITMGREQLAQVAHVLELVTRGTQGTIFSSQGAARRMIQEGGLYINRVQVVDPYQRPDWALLRERYLLIQKGKKHHYLIRVA